MGLNMQKSFRVKVRVKSFKPPVQRMKDWRELYDKMMRMPIPAEPLYPLPTNCVVCGLKFDGPMGYVCGHPQCPTGVSTGVRPVTGTTYTLSVPSPDVQVSW